MLAYISRLPPLSDENRSRGPYALVLAPTRELAQQIESETNKFTKLLGYKCVSIVGGRAIEEQQFNMRHGAEIVIATPGRLVDCLERSVLYVSFFALLGLSTDGGCDAGCSVSVRTS